MKRWDKIKKLYSEFIFNGKYNRAKVHYSFDTGSVDCEVCLAFKVVDGRIYIVDQIIQDRKGERNA